jgi:hypothetical protein
VKEEKRRTRERRTSRIKEGGIMRAKKESSEGPKTK